MLATMVCPVGGYVWTQQLGRKANTWPVMPPLAQTTFHVRGWDDEA